MQKKEFTPDASKPQEKTVKRNQVLRPQGRDSIIWLAAGGIIACSEAITLAEGISCTMFG
jgi:hypothetical protein